MKVYFESPIAVRRSEFRDAKCARHILSYVVARPLPGA